MAIYWLSFTISDRNAKNKSYDERYNDFIDRIFKVSLEHWSETTSFIIFKSNENIDVLFNFFGIALSEIYDLFIIRELDAKSARIFGKNENTKIKNLMPYIK